MKEAGKSEIQIGSNLNAIELLIPAWTAPAVVQAVVTTRNGGASQSPWKSLNLGTHVGDDANIVAGNRARLINHLGLEHEPIWLNQVHGNELFVHGSTSLKTSPVKADASYTTQAGVALAIMIADCLPIIISSPNGREIASLHAGWRGLANGIIKRVIRQFQSNELYAWLGPAIGPCHYEVDYAVKKHFDSEAAFTRSYKDHWMFDLSIEATDQLRQAGVKQIQSADICTYCDSRFFSYRRDGVTGRFVALIWIEDESRTNSG